MDFLLATQPARIEELQYQHKFQCNKIVATTNTLLGLPTLSNEFLQKYCTSGGGRVKVEYTLDKITKEYVDEQDAWGYDFWTYELKVNDDNTINASLSRS